MGSEIERKFLCEPTAAVLDGAATPIWQGYLTIGADSETRVRRAGGKYSLTTKRGKGLVRGEWEIELDAAQFEQMWPATEGLRLNKVRYEVSLDAGECIVDVYEGQLAGLLVAEVEFDSVEAAEAFTPPGWFGAEITGVAQYANQRLATLTAAEVAALSESS
ncbi:MAG TPA: CYTH domain-containing protein [Pseudonocardiaceae bacterium]